MKEEPSASSAEDNSVFSMPFVDAPMKEEPSARSLKEPNGRSVEESTLMADTTSVTQTQQLGLVNADQTDSKPHSATVTQTQKPGAVIAGQTDLRLQTTSVEQTQKVAAVIANQVEVGDLIVLNGSLGAGKTAFVQGFAKALGVTAPVTSPTFTLANRYEGGKGDLVVNHLDVYRLSGASEAQDLAIPELLDEGVTLIEWGEKIEPCLGSSRLEVNISFGQQDDDRHFNLTFVGESWLSRVSVLAPALEPWSIQ